LLTAVKPPKRFTNPLTTSTRSYPVCCLSMILSENRYPLCANAALRVQIMLYWFENVVPLGSGSTASRCAWLFGHTT
jgi:hypothetical protein